MNREIPFLSNQEIHQKVEAFRAKLEIDLQTLPLDATFIAEIDLREPLKID